VEKPESLSLSTEINTGNKVRQIFVIFIFSQNISHCTKSDLYECLMNLTPWTLFRVTLTSDYIFLNNVQTEYGSHQTSYLVRYRGYSCRSMRLTTHPKLVPRLTIAWRFSSTPLHVFKTWHWIKQRVTCIFSLRNMNFGFPSKILHALSFCPF
jgi:hypothetical protein